MKVWPFGSRRRVIIDILSKDGYDIACALRGPDLGPDNCDALKNVFTSRVRALALRLRRSDSIFWGDTRTLKITPGKASRAISEARTLMETNQSGLEHFLGHIVSAARALGDEQLAELARQFQQGNFPGKQYVVELAGGR